MYYCNVVDLASREECRKDRSLKEETKTDLKEKLVTNKFPILPTFQVKLTNCYCTDYKK